MLKSSKSYNNKPTVNNSWLSLHQGKSLFMVQNFFAPKSVLNQCEQQVFL